jgi:hypothetical protein
MKHLGLALFLALVGCRPPSVGEHVSPLALHATDGALHSLPPTESEAKLTVLVFSAWHCPCQNVHDSRLGALYAHYHPQGVDFFPVDSEVSGSLPDDAAKAKERGYPFPVLLDPGAGLARTLRAEYATESFVIDRQGMVRYHGGIDSDRSRLHNDAVPLLANALDDLLTGRPLRAADTKALGCALQTW